MTNVKNFVGIDVSKNYFDAAIVKNVGKQEFIHERFDCNASGFKLFGKWMKEQIIGEESQTVICMEHTGIYNWPIVKFLEDKKYVLCIEMAMQIKLSLGIQRGKNDKLDAKRIAEYACVQQAKLKQWLPSGELIEKLQHLMAARDRMVRSIKIIEAPLNEFNAVGNKEMFNLLNKTQKPVLLKMRKALGDLENEIKKTINEDEKIKIIFKQITSVKGIGDVIGAYLIIYTKGFTIMADKKKLGSYAGVVPFDHTSGKTVRKRSRTDKMTNAVLRRNLCMGAKSAMQWDAELKAYAQRKMSEGKTYAWCITAVSNKLLARVVSCVKNQKEYVEKKAA
jgi:transposase